MILRPDYINAISSYIDTPLVKILAGVRRCGKSTILEMVQEELVRRGVSREKIIARNYASAEFEDGFTAKDMYADLKDADIYVTGSNSKLMSSEIETYLTGRYVSIPVYTLSFREYLTFKNKPESDARAVFDEYLRYGGFPVIGVSSFDTKSAYQVIEGIYASVIIRDIRRFVLAMRPPTTV